MPNRTTRPASPLCVDRRAIIAGGVSLLSLLSLPLTARLGHAAIRAGMVEATTGECIATRAAAPARRLAPQEDVFVGDLIATKAQSSVGMLLGKATRVRLGAETRFRIDRFVINAGGVLVLERGAMLYDHDPADGADAVTVRSPFGLLAVRGTRFFAGPTKGEFSVFVEQGSVTVVGRNTAVQLGPGQGSGMAKPGDEPSLPITWGKARIEEAMALVGL